MTAWYLVVWVLFLLLLLLLSSLPLLLVHYATIYCARFFTPGNILRTSGCSTSNLLGVPLRTTRRLPACSGGSWPRLSTTTSVTDIRVPTASQSASHNPGHGSWYLNTLSKRSVCEYDRQSISVPTCLSPTITSYSNYYSSPVRQ